MVSMEDDNENDLHDFHLASRKAEEAGLRRYQAVHWLECFVGPLRIPSQPSEMEFVSCLRNGLILCNAINKIHPGAVPKIVERQPSEAITWDSNALPAYQYFENVKNFLAAVEELKLPSFQASDLEKEGFESRSVCRVVDCILALKAYHELKEYRRGTGNAPKPLKSPMVLHSSSKKFTGISNANYANRPCRRLNLSATDYNSSVQDVIAKALVNRMLETKENINYSLLSSLRNSSIDPVNKFRKILTDCLEGQLEISIPELSFSSESCLKEGSCTVPQSSSALTNLPTSTNIKKFAHVSLRKHGLEPWNLLRKQEKELLEIKVSLTIAKNDFEELNFQFFNDLKQIGNLVQEMSAAALGYQKVIKENRNLYNTVQDLKGSIRVYCRVRPIFDLKAKNVVDFIGDDGSLVLVDPSKPRNGRQVFQFNQVFGPTASQEELLRDIRPLTRSVMDGYNVCIFAYGQTGSGKTYTMSGLSDGSVEAKGINYLALKDLFNMSAQKKNLVNYGFHMEMVEIYNEEVRDLLAQELSNTMETVSHANVDELGIPKTTFHSVKSVEDANNLIKRGEYNRAINSAAMNIECSHSHSVFTIHVHGEDKSGSAIQGRLYLVDLARSDREESQQVDKSLSCLQDVITALSQKSSYIPYRNSKLTLLLQDALGGSAKTLMFAHISPEADNLEKTLNTLKFAQKVSTVELGATCSNKKNTEVIDLKQKVEHLKKALLNKEAQSAHPSLQLKSPNEKPNVARPRTPQPRNSRRLSIENPSATKFQATPNTVGNKTKCPKSPTQLSVRRCRRLSIEPDKDQGRKTPYKHSVVKPEDIMPEKTLPPRSRRLSIETPTSMGLVSAHNPQACKEQKSPYRGARGGRMDRTPPKFEGQSNENSSVVKSKKESRGKMNKTPLPSRAHHATERASNGARRLSLEGPVTNLPLEIVENERDTSFVEASSITDSMSMLSHEETLHRPSPGLYLDLADLVQHKTPDRHILGRKEAQLNTENSTITSALQHETPSSTITSARVKGSHIRKSLRSIGKLINGSDRRKHRNTETSSTKGRFVKGQTESSVAAQTRTLRRQSLTGTLRRSSLGGKSTDTDVGETRRSKTPPPKQWV